MAGTIERDCTVAAAYKTRFLLNSGTAERQGVLQALPDVFDGLHLTSRNLLTMKVRPAGITWLAASCHSPEELRVAEALGVDFVTLSPVRVTSSHPDAQPLGEQRFAEWVATARMPVYGLGGLTPQDTEQLRNLGAQGVAGISGLWCREAE
ncbi:MAG: thiamine phosphate synthase [Gammaproteobacteria bacterium]